MPVKFLSDRLRNPLVPWVRYLLDVGTDLDAECSSVALP